MNYNELPGHGTVGEDPIYNWKSPYLIWASLVSVPLRSLGVVASGCLRYFSFNTDKTGSVQNTHNARLSSIGIFLCGGADLRRYRLV